MSKRRTLPIVALAVALALLPLTGAQAAPEAGFVPAWPGVKFTNPLGVVSAKDGTGALYVLEQAGAIQRMAGPAGTPGQPALFLDIKAKVFPRLQGGVLGLAFHPAYAQNRRLFVCYVAETGDPQLPFKIVLSEFKGGATCDPRSERVLLEIPKTLALHNGGCLRFGPDAKLYMSTGDNAKQKEALQTSQNPDSLLGKILRIDIDRPSPGLPYGIPADNPWATAGAGVRPEIWAYGMRNPWRFTFDAKGTLWTGEPGTKGAQCREWIVAVQRGQNHGWPFFEGTQPAEPLPPNLAGMQFVKPAYEYARPDPEGQTAIIGGVFYQGSRVPGLTGQYLFSDYGLGQVMAIDLSTGKGRNARVLAQLARIASIDADDQGELYFCGHEDGIVYTLVAPR